MTEEIHPLAALNEETLDALLRRAFRNTLILGAVCAVICLISAGWRNGAMMATGALISAASVLEWKRMVQLMNARMKNKQTPRGAILVLAFFLLRLIFFAGAIYVSLKCFQGSVLILMFGLSLAVATLTWEAVRLLRD
jgi:hypothetical protein